MKQIKLAFLFSSLLASITIGYLVHSSSQESGLAKDVNCPLSLAGSSTGKLSISFDDGYKGVYDKASQVLSERCFKASLFINSSENYSHSGYDNEYMTWLDIQEISSNLGWEVGSHGLRHTDISRGGELIDQEIVTSKQNLLEKGYTVNGISPPFGSYSSKNMNVIKSEFKYMRRAWPNEDELYNSLPYNNYSLNAVTIESDMTPEYIVSMIDDIQRSGDWLILVFHDIVESSQIDSVYDYSSEDFDYFVSQIPNDIEVNTISNILSL